MALPAYDMLTWSGIFGAIGTPVEQWSFSLKLEPVENANTPVSKAFTGMETYAAQIKAHMPPSTILTRTRFSQHVAGGDVEQDAQGAYVQADNFTTHAGTGAENVKYPLQTALCVSLITGRAGPTGKGRFFLPMPTKPLDAGYRISAGDANTMATVAKNLLNGVVSCGIPVVASSKGYRSAVTAVRVGRVVDTIRTRRADLAEDYSTLTLA